MKVHVFFLFTEQLGKIAISMSKNAKNIHDGPAVDLLLSTTFAVTKNNTA